MRFWVALVVGIVMIFTARHAWDLAMGFLGFYIVMYGGRHV